MEIDRVMRRQRATLQWLRELRRLPCADCNGAFPAHVMDFDHRDPSLKTFSLCSDKVLLKPRAVLLAEIEKCDVVCANCHAARTFAQLLERRARSTFEEWNPGKSPRVAKRRAKRRAQAAILRRLRDTPCKDCGRRFGPYSMQFDHLDPTKKTGPITQMVGRAGDAKILAEIATCDIVCANCHRDRTYRRRASAGVVQWQERKVSNLDVRGSSPLARSEGDLQLRLIREPKPRYVASAPR